MAVLGSDNVGLKWKERFAVDDDDDDDDGVRQWTVYFDKTFFHKYEEKFSINSECLLF